MSKGKFSGYHGTIRQAVRQAEREYLRNREPETKKTEKRREATGDVVAMCVLCALNREFGLGESRLQRVADRAGLIADQFDTRNKVQGWAKAKKWLAEEVREVFAGDFLLPVIVAPKKRRDWDALATQRDVADTVVKFYIKALREVMGFGEERTAAFVKAVEREYRAFGDWAKDGDYYGYHRLAQQMGAILRTEVIVDESGASEPIFGKTLD